MKRTTGAKEYVLDPEKGVKAFLARANTECMDRNGSSNLELHALSSKSNTRNSGNLSVTSLRYVHVTCLRAAGLVRKSVASTGRSVFFGERHSHQHVLRRVTVPEELLHDLFVSRASQAFRFVHFCLHCLVHNILACRCVTPTQ